MTEALRVAIHHPTRQRYERCLEFDRTDRASIEEQSVGRESIIFAYTIDVTDGHVTYDQLTSRCRPTVNSMFCRRGGQELREDDELLLVSDQGSERCPHPRGMVAGTSPRLVTR